MFEAFLSLVAIGTLQRGLAVVLVSYCGTYLLKLHSMLRIKLGPVKSTMAAWALTLNLSNRSRLSWLDTVAIIGCYWWAFSPVTISGAWIRTSGFKDASIIPLSITIPSGQKSKVLIIHNQDWYPWRIYQLFVKSPKSNIANRKTYIFYWPPCDQVKWL